MKNVNNQGKKYRPVKRIWEIENFASLCDRFPCFMIIAQLLAPRSFFLVAS